MEKKDRDFVTYGTIKALASMVPFLAPFVSVYSDTLSDIKEKRVEELITNLKEQIAAHAEIINKPFLESSDFMELLEKTATRVSVERSEIKRLAYKNIMLHGATSKDSSADITDNQLRVLDQLNETHVYLLKFLKDPHGYVKEMSIQIAPTNSATTFIKQVFAQWSLEYIRDHLADLEGYRLIEPISGGLMTISMEPGILRFQNVLTTRGKTFLSFMIQ